MNFEKKVNILDNPEDTVSLSSFSSRISVAEKLDHIIDQSESNRVARISKLILLILGPIAALIALSGILLYVSLETAYEMERAKIDVDFIIDMAGLVEKAQNERGTTASWISIQDYHSRTKYKKLILNLFNFKTRSSSRVV